jgi:hypothetical protein
MGTLTTDPARDSMVEVANLLHRELYRLAEHDCAIRGRIRSLHRVLHGLQEGVGQLITGDLHAEVRRSALRQSPTEPGASESVAVGGSDLRTGQEAHGQASRSHCRLRRACRIALMEVDEAASAEEIYSRIVRRGAFSFNNLEYAIVAIVRTLNVMAKDGETCSAEHGPCSRWKRTTREEVP